MWTRDSLHKLVEEKFRDYLFVAVSNRESYVHSHALGETLCDRPPSGLTTEPAFSLANVTQEVVQLLVAGQHSLSWTWTVLT